jgi:hypothetical protein
MPGVPDAATPHPERALTELLLRARLAPADTLPTIVAEAARHLAGRDVVLQLVDHAQAALIPFGSDGEPADIEGTMAGRAFQHIEMVSADAGEGRARVHLPLLDSVERVGTLSLTVPAAHDREMLTAFSSLVAEVLRAKVGGSDVMPRVARLERMSLAGEIQWTLLPPLTVATERIVIASMLEPCYDVGGDVVDYAIDSQGAHIAIFDAMGHELPATILASVAVGAYRNARRAGSDLVAIAEAVDAAVGEQFRLERLVTGVLAHLDLGSGRLRWVNAGHPPPLLLRGGRMVKELAGRPEPPLGLGLRTATTVHEEALEPGDRLLAYTDGVVEAHAEGGEQFGIERLVDVVATAEAAGVHAPETMRRLSHAVLEHGRFELRDDATHLLVEWLSGEPERLVL